MKKILLTIICSLFIVHCSFAYADDECRTSIFSTSTDWEAVTGMYLDQYKIVFGRDKTFGGIGTELYYLDGFPCYGQTDSVRAWVAPSIFYDVDPNAYMRITCLTYPETVNLAYREASSQAFQARTKYLLKCKTEKSGADILVKLQNCEKIDWKDYGKK